MTDELRRIAELGRRLRVDGIRCPTAAGSGDPTSSVSAADPMSARSAPVSGTPAQLLGAAGIDADHIARAVRALVRERPRPGTKGGRQ